jgi:Gpi18-like mannosyltransferase
MHLARSFLPKLLSVTRSALARVSPVSRGLILFLAFWICFVHLLPAATSRMVRQHQPGPDHWSPEMRAVQTPLSRWDARWYFTIATKGYSKAGLYEESTVRFYPLYPVFMAATSWVTRTTPLWAGTIVSVLALLGTVLLLARRARENADDEAASAVTQALLFFPSAFILATVYSDSLALFGMVLSVTLARRGQWWGAGLAGAAVSMTRVNGCLVLLPLLVLAIEVWRKERRWRPLPGLLLTMAGAAAFPIYLGCKFGDPLLYLHTRSSGWPQHPRFFLFYLWDVAQAVGTALAGGIVPRNVQTMPMVAFPVNIAVMLVLFWTLAESLRKRRWDDVALMTGGCLFAASVGSLDSLARHGLIYFPIYLRLGETFMAHRTLRSMAMPVFLATQTVLIMLFSHWWFVL